MKRSGGFFPCFRSNYSSLFRPLIAGAQGKRIEGEAIFIFQRHAIDSILSGEAFETGIDHYLRNLAVQEAVYQSAERGIPREVEYLEEG